MNALEKKLAAQLLKEAIESDDFDTTGVIISHYKTLMEACRIRLENQAVAGSLNTANGVAGLPE